MIFFLIRGFSSAGKTVHKRSSLSKTQFCSFQKVFQLFALKSISCPASFFIICFQLCNCDLTAFQLFNQTKGILMDFPKIANIIVKLFESGSSGASALCPCRSMTKLNKLVHIQRNHLTCSKKCIWETRVCGCSWLCYLCWRAVGTVESV